MEPTALVHRWFDALKRRSIADLLACCGEEAVYDPPAGGRAVGRAAIEAQLIHAFARGRDSIADVVVLAEPSGLHVAAEYTLNGSTTAAVFFEVDDGALTRITEYRRATVGA